MDERNNEISQVVLEEQYKLHMVSFARKISTVDNVPQEETILARIDSLSRHDGTLLLSIKLVFALLGNDGRIPKVFEMTKIWMITIKILSVSYIW